MTRRYDAVVIGTGQAGPSLAGRLADAGQKVAVIERHRFGGTCVNTGCIPTKTLVASARVAYLARRAGEDFEKAVAIKVLRGGLSSEGLLRRFRAERRMRDKRRRGAIQKRIMTIDWSWREPAREYVELYRSLCR